MSKSKGVHWTGKYFQMVKRLNGFIKGIPELVTVFIMALLRVLTDASCYDLGLT